MHLTPQTNMLTANSFDPLSTLRGEGVVLLAIAKENGGEAGLFHSQLCAKPNHHVIAKLFQYKKLK